MKPIYFACHSVVPLAGSAIVQQILQVERWPDFKGYGPLPGIRQAVITQTTEGIVGTTIAVTNTDGSTHQEEIIAWHPDTRLEMKMSKFSKPLSHLATHFDEIWDFAQSGQQTSMTRTFRLHPKSSWSKPLLWLISLLLRRAIEKHNRVLVAQAATLPAGSP
jgi:hypothetical protein